MSQVVFVFGVYRCQVSRSCSVHLDIIGVQSVGNQWEWWEDPAQKLQSG